MHRPSLPEMMAMSKFNEAMSPSTLTFDQNSNMKLKPMYKKYDAS